MSKININFDMMHVIKEAKGIKKYPKELSYINIPMTIALPTVAWISAIQEKLSIDAAIILCAATAGITISLKQLVFNLILKKHTIKLAENELMILTLLLDELNIKTNPKLLLKSEVYYKEYELKKDSPVGIIRNRYINIPNYKDGNYKDGKEVMISIKEEHLISSNEYIISVGKPIEKKEKVFRKALGTA